jgi:hypothetical protein
MLRRRPGGAKSVLVVYLDTRGISPTIMSIGVHYLECIFIVRSGHWRRFFTGSIALTRILKDTIFYVR